MIIFGFDIKIKKVKYAKQVEFLEKVEEAVKHGGWEAAKEVCRNTEGMYSFVAYEIIELGEKYKIK